MRVTCWLVAMFLPSQLSLNLAVSVHSDVFDDLRSWVCQIRGVELVVVAVIALRVVMGLDLRSATTCVQRLSLGFDWCHG